MITRFARTPIAALCRYVLPLTLGAWFQVWAVEDVNVIWTADQGVLSNLAFSPDGSQLAAATSQGVRIYQPANGQLLKTFTPHVGLVLSVAYSSDGQWLASGGIDSKIYLWRVADWAMVSSVDTAPFKVQSLAFQPGSGRLIGALAEGDNLADRESKSRCWLVGANGELTHAWTSTGYGNQICFLPDGQRFLDGGLYATKSGHLAQKILVNYALDGANDRVIEDARDPYAALPNGLHVATELAPESGYDGHFAICRISDGGEILSLGALLEGVAVSPDGQWFLGGSFHRGGSFDVRLYQLPAFTVFKELNLNFSERIAFSPDNRYLACRFPDGILAVVANPASPDAPSISGQPLNRQRVMGSQVVFSVTANGLQPLRYQWEHTGTPLPGATNASLTLTNLQIADEGPYRVVVSNILGAVTSAAAQLTILKAPAIQNQPISREVPASYNLNLIVSALGALPMSYQWQHAGTNLPHATNALLMLFNLQEVNGGDYRAIVTNAYGSATSQVATLTIKPTPPLLLQQPQGQVVAFGSNAVFQVQAAGSQPMGYEWRHDNLLFWNQTNAILRLNDVDTTAAGNYWAIVHNSYGSITSQVATLDVVNPSALVQPEVLWKRGSHRLPLTALATSPDSQFVASGSLDGTVKVWQTADARQLADLQAHEEGVGAVEFLPDSFTLATIGREGNTLKFWNLPNGGHIRNLTLGTNIVINRLAFSPDGSMIATVSKSTRSYGGKLGFSYGVNTVHVDLWFSADGRLWSRSETEEQDLTALAFSPDGLHLASAEAQTGDLVIRSVTDGRLIRRLRGHKAPITTLSYSADGALLTTGDQQGQVRLWRTATGALATTLDIHDHPILTLALRQSLVSIDEAGWVSSTRLADSALEWTYGLGSQLVAACLTPDGRSFFTANGSVADLEAATLPASGVATSEDSLARTQAVQLRRLDSGNWRGTYTSHSKPVTCLAFSENGGNLITGGLDRSLKLWSSPSGRILMEMQDPPVPIQCLALSPNAAWVACAGEEPKIHLYDAFRGTFVRSIQAGMLPPRGLVFTREGNRLAACGDDGMLRLLNVTDGTLWKSVIAHPGVVQSVACSPDGMLLATGGSDAAVKLWNATNLANIVAATLHVGPVKTLAFSSKGALLASGGTDGVVNLWQLPSLQLLRGLHGHHGSVLSVSFTPDGKTVASVGQDGTVRLWQVSDGLPLAIYNQETSGALCAAFSPLGDSLALGREDGAVLAFNDDHTSLPPYILRQPIDASARAGGHSAFLCGSGRK